MFYFELSIQYSVPKPIARADDGRVIYAVGAALDGAEIAEYGYIGSSALLVSEIPARTKLLPVDSFLKYTPSTHWEYFEQP